MSSPTPAELFQHYKILLTEVFTKQNPQGIRSIEPLLNKFPGKEHQVYLQICKNFGIEPEGPPTADDFVNGVPKRALKTPSSGGKVLIWLTQNGFNKYTTQPQFQKIAWEEFLTISTERRLLEMGVIPKHAQFILEAIQSMSKDQFHTPPSGLEEKYSIEEKASQFHVGESCYTKMIKDENEEALWLMARITHVNDNNTYDIFVLNSKAHNVPPEAVNVPASFLKKSSEKVQVAVPERRPQIKPGARIKVFGLRSHIDYNGVCGSVVIYMPKDRRYQVRLDTGDVIAIKQRNVELEKVQPSVDILSAAKDVAMKKLNNVGTVTPADEAMLSALLQQLIKDSPTSTDPVKLGGFAAGFLISKKKLEANQ